MEMLDKLISAQNPFTLALYIWLLLILKKLIALGFDAITKRATKMDTLIDQVTQMANDTKVLKEATEKASEASDRLVEQVSHIASDSKAFKIIIENEREKTKKAEEDLKEVKQVNGKIMHRLVRIEMRLQLEDENKDH